MSEELPLGKVTKDEVLEVIQELYPQALNHAVSEARARRAEKKLQQLLEEQVISEPIDEEPDNEGFSDKEVDEGN